MSLCSSSRLPPSLPSPLRPPSRRRAYHKWHQLPGRACGGDPGDKEVSHSTEQRGLCASQSGCNSDDLCIKGICFPALCGKDAESRSLGTLRELLDEEFVPPQRSDSIVISCLDVLLGRFDFVVIREISLLL